MRPETYLSIQEFCERYGVKRRTAQRWRVTGDGPRWVRMGLRKIAYRLSDCENWAASHTFAHRAEEAARSLTQSTHNVAA